MIVVANAHAHQREDQHRFAAKPVAEVAEDNGADRPGEEADTDGADREQLADQRVLRGKEQLVENERRGGAVN